MVVIVNIKTRFFLLLLLSIVKQSIGHTCLVHDLKAKSNLYKTNKSVCIKIRLDDLSLPQTFRMVLLWIYT